MASSGLRVSWAASMEEDEPLQMPPAAAGEAGGDLHQLYTR